MSLLTRATTLSTLFSLFFGRSFASWASGWRESQPAISILTFPRRNAHLPFVSPTPNLVKLEYRAKVNSRVAWDKSGGRQADRQREKQPRPRRQRQQRAPQEMRNPACQPSLPPKIGYVASSQCYGGQYHLFVLLAWLQVRAGEAAS